MDIAAINSTPKYRTIIVDDEPPALAKLSYLLKDYEDFELVGSFDNADVCPGIRQGGAASGGLP